MYKRGQEKQCDAFSPTVHQPLRCYFNDAFTEFESMVFRLFSIKKHYQHSQCLAKEKHGLLYDGLPSNACFWVKWKGR
jgi:hypothetical protein